MKKPNETDSLNEMILRQEQQYDNDLRVLRDQFHIAYESLKPINFIKNVVHEVTASPEIKNDMVDNVIGLATGFISKKLLVDGTDSPVKKVFGTILQFAVANVVSKHTYTIKTVGENLLNYFSKEKNNY
ncbi:MAG: hypothetical protein V4572_01355 [Bacteroidota bacterium]